MSNGISGQIHISNDVLADIVGNAAMHCYGIVGMVSPDGTDTLLKRFTSSRLRRGIVITDTAKGIHVDLYVSIEYGTNLNTVSQNLRETTAFVLEKYTRIPVEGIDVHVMDVKISK